MKRRKQRGSTMVEAALSMLVLMPLLMGTSVVGTNLARSIQTAQLCRDAGHMYAYGVDFAQTANKNLLTHLAQGFNIQQTSGSGAIVFSTLTYVGSDDCAAAGVKANTSDCPNLNISVVVRRLVVGDKTKLTSHFATPAAGIVQSDGYIGVKDYVKDKSVRATGFSNIMSLTPGQYAHLTEVYVANPDLDWKGFMSGSGSYSFNIF